MFNFKKTRTLQNYRYYDTSHETRSFKDFDWLKYGPDMRCTGLLKIINYCWSYMWFVTHATAEEMHYHNVYRNYYQDDWFALDKIYDEIKERRNRMKLEKEVEIGRELDKKKFRSPYADEEYDERKDEALRWEDRCLSNEEINERYTPSSTLGFIPAVSELIDEPIIESKVDIQGVGYVIYDKKYNTYTATAICPARYLGQDESGKNLYKVEQVIRREHLWQIREDINAYVANEKQAYNDFISRCAGKATKTNKTSKKVNINHVKEAMGQGTVIDEGLDEDIF